MAVKTVFLGTSPYAEQVMRTLDASDHEIVLVVTRPDRPKGRGRKVQAPPVAEAAKQLGLDLIQPQDLNTEEVLDRVNSVKPDLISVCAYGALIKEPLLSSYMMLNVHPSLLPRWRGAAPIERAIMAGDSKTGVVIMQVTAGLDSGPVALVETVEITAEDSYGTLAPKLAQIGGRLLVKALGLRGQGQLHFTDQDEAEATYADKISAQDRIIDPSGEREEIANRVRALSPHIGAYLAVEDGGRLQVLEVVTTSEQVVPAGQLLANQGRVFLGCKGGALELKIIQPEGKRPMAAADFLRGSNLPRL